MSDGVTSCPDAQNAAQVIGQAAGALIEAMGMEAANRQAAAKGHAEPYGEAAFAKLIETNGLHWNALISTLFREGRP